MTTHSQTQAFARNCACLIGLVSVIVDALICVRKEREYIWQYPISRVKLLYVLSRYGAIVIQLVAYSVAVSSPAFLSDSKLCYEWILFQHFSFMSLYSILELVLMLRVYALYKKSLRVATTLTFIFLLEIVLSIYSAIFVIPRMAWDEKCIVREAPKDIAVFGLVVFQNQSIIAGLTVWRYRHAIKDGWAHIPIVKTVMRDGAWMFFALTVVFAATIPYSMFVEHMSHVFFSLLIALISIFACRLILNMHSCTSTNPSNDTHSEDDVQLTTFINSLSSYVESDALEDTDELRTSGY